MGWLSVAAGILAAVLLYGKKPSLLFIAAVIVTAGDIWSFGIMHNYATSEARKRQNYSGNFYDITLPEALSVPDWITFVNLICSLLAFLLFIVAIIKIV